MRRGGKQDPARVAALVLSTHALDAYMGHKPHWWPNTGIAGYERMPNSVGGLPAIVFWRDVCASHCLRHHDDDVEMVEVDLRQGLWEGSNTDTTPSTCVCYAYGDLSNTSAAAAATPSHEAPNDLAMATFLKTASLVNNYVGIGAHDLGLRYRQLRQPVRGAPRPVGGALRARGAVDRLLQARARAGRTSVNGYEDRAHRERGHVR